MKKYHVFKILGNGPRMFAHAIYAESREAAREKALSFYKWNNWLTESNCIVKIAR